MRKLLNKIIDKCLMLLYGEPAFIMVYLTRKLGSMVEAELFTNGKQLEFIMIEAIDGQYSISIMPKGEGIHENE